jgi:demethylmenaquinone methyltransferase/2-methoxy-6-polyprenyl-1,4-benzoquinol methylase
MDERIIAEQVAYYRARASEYDEWFLRLGRYDRGSDLNRQWFAEAETAVRALRTLAPFGRVLELACGTGLWTGHLLEAATSVTAVDASPEVLAIHRERFGDGVERVQADIFSLKPPGRFDTVFFSFWLSHVPPARFDTFWRLVAACLAPGGRAFFVDSLRDATSTAVNHVLSAEGAVIQERLLNDGRAFRVVKVYYEPPELQERLDRAGWEASVSSTGRYFLYGSAARKTGS